MRGSRARAGAIVPTLVLAANAGSGTPKDAPGGACDGAELDDGCLYR